jgi:hypothetical protein
LTLIGVKWQKKITTLKIKLEACKKKIISSHQQCIPEEVLLYALFICTSAFELLEKLTDD